MSFNRLLHFPCKKNKWKIYISKINDITSIWGQGWTTCLLVTLNLKGPQNLNIQQTKFYYELYNVIVKNWVIFVWYRHKLKVNSRNLSKTIFKSIQKLATYKWTISQCHLIMWQTRGSWSPEPISITCSNSDNLSSIKSRFSKKYLYSFGHMLL